MAHRSIRRKNAYGAFIRVIDGGTSATYKLRESGALSKHVKRRGRIHRRPRSRASLWPSRFPTVCCEFDSEETVDCDSRGVRQPRMRIVPMTACRETRAGAASRCFPSLQSESNSGSPSRICRDSPTAEALRSGRRQCGFESRPRYSLLKERYYLSQRSIGRKPVETQDAGPRHVLQMAHGLTDCGAVGSAQHWGCWGRPFKSGQSD